MKLFVVDMIVGFFISFLILFFIFCVNISVDYEVLNIILLDINYFMEWIFRELIFFYK